VEARDSKETFAMIPFLDLRAEYEGLKAEIAECLQTLFSDGRYILGENVEAFEAEFASYCGTRFAIGVASGTDALRLSLLVCGVGPDDEVITASNSAIATALAISACGATPVLIDSNVYYNLVTEQIEARITRRTKAVIPVHLYGHPADCDETLRITEKHGLALIEDASQAHGARYKGRMVGSLGRLGCFSFYPTKNLGGYGDGGIITTDDPSLCDKLRSLRNLGKSGADTYSTKGFNSRLDELQAAVLRVKLKRLNAWNERRRKLASIYDSILKPIVTTPKEAPYAKHVYHQYVIRTDQRDRLQKSLSEKGIQTMIHYPVPIHLQEAYSDLRLQPGSYPSTEKYSKEILSLPIHPSLSDEQVGSVAESIRQFLH
jgi:dTDP-4-amino-4,6-dideoxygalactose transaminase